MHLVNDGVLIPKYILSERQTGSPEKGAAQDLTELRDRCIWREKGISAGESGGREKRDAVQAQRPDDLRPTTDGDSWLR
jgi:hypothetical protein